MSKFFWLSAAYREVDAGLLLLAGLDFDPEEVAVVGQRVFVEDRLLYLDERAGFAVLHEDAAQLDHSVSVEYLRS